MQGLAFRTSTPAATMLFAGCLSTAAQEYATGAIEQVPQGGDQGDRRCVRGRWVLGKQREPDPGRRRVDHRAYVHRPSGRARDKVRLQESHRRAGARVPHTPRNPVKRRDLPRHFEALRCCGTRSWELRWWGLVCVATRGRNLFPSAASQRRRCRVPAAALGSSSETLPSTNRSTIRFAFSRLR